MQRSYQINVLSIQVHLRYRCIQNPCHAKGIKGFYSGLLLRTKLHRLLRENHLFSAEIVTILCCPEAVHLTLGCTRSVVHCRCCGRSMTYVHVTLGDSAFLPVPINLAGITLEDATTV